MIAHVLDEATILDFALFIPIVAGMVVGLAIVTRPARPQPISRRALNRLHTDEQETS